MDLLKLNFLQQGLFKQARYLVSTPAHSQGVVMISETGVISKDLYEMNLAQMNPKDIRRSYLALHKLKVSIKEPNGKIQDNQVFLITERNYIPLDPFNRLDATDILSMTPLKEVARLRHACLLYTSPSPRDRS